MHLRIEWEVVSIQCHLDLITDFFQTHWLLSLTVVLNSRLHDLLQWLDGSLNIINHL